MKKIVFIFALLGFGIICLQQKSYADKKTAHAEYSSSAIAECNSCHKSEGVAPNHDADFVRGHRVLASKAGNNCSECHDQKWCLDCHKGGSMGDNLSQGTSGRDYTPKSHRSDFMSIHPIKAQGNPQQCYRCHDAKAFCNSCHSRFPTGNLRIKSHIMGQTANWALGEHPTEARRNLQSCQACHPEGDVCVQCHSSGKANPHPRSWKSGNIKKRTDEKMCKKCHLPGTY